MLDRTKHENTMRNILNEVYSHKDLSPILGFKGGTACYFFYELPRFSTDLDFNLLNYDHPTQTNPTLFIHSVTDPDSANDEWVSFTHDVTDAIITSGSGKISGRSLDSASLQVEKS